MDAGMPSPPSAEGREAAIAALAQPDSIMEVNATATVLQFVPPRRPPSLSRLTVNAYVYSTKQAWINPLEKGIEVRVLFSRKQIASIGRGAAGCHRTARWKLHRLCSDVQFT